MVVGDPAQERHGLLALVLEHGKGRALDHGDDLGRLAEHRPPVAHGAAHIGEHALDSAGEAFERLRRALEVDLILDERFRPDATAGRRISDRTDQAGFIAQHAHDRVHDLMHMQAFAH